MSPKPSTRLFAGLALTGAALLLAGCSAEEPVSTVTSDAPAEQSAEDSVTRSKPHPDNARQYTETLYPGVPGTIFVPTKADYERLEAALTNQLGCGMVVSGGDAGLECVDGNTREGAQKYVAEPADDANFGHEFGDDGYVSFVGGYELLDEYGRGLGDEYGDPGGQYNPETGTFKSLS